MAYAQQADYRDLAREELRLIDQIDQHKRTIRLEAERIEWLRVQLDRIYKAQDEIRQNERKNNGNRNA